jgi:ribosome biogenesis GTPase
VVETTGRRVLVRDDEGERNCFLSGLRAVVGDEVRWTEAPGEGGKLISVEPRRTALKRYDPRGEEQVLVANLAGLVVVSSAKDPVYMGALVDRYVVAAGTMDLDAIAVITKIDLGVSADVEAEIGLREAAGLETLRVSTSTGEGISALAGRLAQAQGSWVLVGLSGVGKTSLISALLPGDDVGPIGTISDYWSAGKHTTTHTRLFSLPGGGEIADSPGIRGFVPAGLDPRSARDHYPGIRDLQCRYRDCMHRPGEDGCVADRDVAPALLDAWRGLLYEVDEAIRRRSP